MRQLYFLLLFTLTASIAHGTNYYFSSSGGDDSRTMLQAQNPATPWRSITKLNSFNLGLRPGDSVLFKRGDVFYGSMVVKAVGTATDGIYYGAFGTGSNPVISGFTTLAGWTHHSGSVYYAPLDAPPALNMVTVNNEAKGMGRYPNTGYLNYESNNGNSSITDNQLLAAPNWTGAEIVMRKYRFILDRHTVTSHAGTTLHYSLSSHNGNNSGIPVKGNGYFLQNHLGTLDQFGEWWYDATAKRLYMHFGGQLPASYQVKASTLATNCFVTTAKFLTFENLQFEGGNEKGLWLTSTANTLVKNCQFVNQGGYALHAVDVNWVAVQGGSVTTSFSNGIYFESNTNNCTIDGVTVSRSNTIPGTARSGTGMSVGITVNGNGNRVVNNRVFNSGYSGISFLGNDVLIEKNLVDTYCTLKDDGGGIYTYVGASNADAWNRKINNNIILNAVGAFAGAESYYYERYGKAAGIYLDEHVNNVEMSGNVVANGDWGGLFLHNAHHCTVTDNLFYNHRYQVLVSQYTPDTRSLRMLRNQYVAKRATQETFFYRTFVFDSPATMGTLDSNWYARPLDDNKTIHVDNFWTGGDGTQQLTLTQWKSAFNLDPSSKKSPLTFTGNIDDSLRFEYNATQERKIISLDGSYLDVQGNQHAGVVALPPFSGIVLLRSRVAYRPNQAITFPAIPSKTVGDAPFALAATASSNLPVSYQVLSGPATVAGNMVTVNGVGQVTIEASQSGNMVYNPAPSVTQTFTVNPVKLAQAISFSAVGNKTYGSEPFLLHGTASSGLPVRFRVVSGPGQLSQNVVSITGVGTIVLEATQDGNLFYHPAPAVVQQIVVAKSQQVISFPAIYKKFNTDSPFSLQATASSGLPVSYRVISGPAQLNEHLVTLTGTGQVTLEAVQQGNENFHAAKPVQQTFLVERYLKLHQSINFPTIANKTTADQPFALFATATSGLPVSYLVLSGPAQITGNLVTLTGAGEVWIEASQQGDYNYNASQAVSRNFMVTPAVTKRTQQITFPTIATQVYGDPPLTLNAFSSSGLPVQYSVLSGPAVVQGNKLTLQGAGFVTIQASQSGDNIFLAAEPVKQSILVQKKAQVINFPSLPAVIYGDKPFGLHATASSGLPVQFRVLQGPAAMVGTVIVLTGSGAVWIEASQPGDANYQAASASSQQLVVSLSAESPTVRYEWLCPLATKQLFAGRNTTGTSFQWQVDRNDGRGYTNLLENTVYIGTATPYLTLSKVPSSTYGYVYRCRMISAGITTYSSETVVKFYAVWSGVSDTAWEASANWACGVQPDEFTDVLIPAGGLHQPIVQLNSACRTLRLEGNSTLRVKAGVIFTVKGQKY